jgi:hypothetical protein
LARKICASFESQSESFETYSVFHGQQSQAYKVDKKVVFECNRRTEGNLLLDPQNTYIRGRRKLTLFKRVAGAGDLSIIVEDNKPLTTTPSR